LSQQNSPISSINTQSSSRPISPAENQLVEFVSVVLADTEDTWHALFNKMGKTYTEHFDCRFTNQILKPDIR
jgi:predicted metalloprotease